MHVVISGWFAGREVGSGQYTDNLLAALQPGAGVGAGAGADTGHRFTLEPPPRQPTPLGKLIYEQLLLPRRARGADLIHVPYWGPPLFSPVPIVVTVHDLIPLVLPAYRARWSVRTYSRLATSATRRAAAVIADSEHTATDLQRHLGVPPSRVRVIPLGVAAHYRPDADVAAARAAYALPARYGLYLGGFDARKDLATLITAWRAVHAATGVPLVIAGRLPQPFDPLAPHPAALAEQAGLEAPASRTIGFVPETAKPGLFAGAAVFAYPSRYEGFGLPPLEAMACGTPVVVADATSLPEVVGQAALRVVPGDIAAWTGALRTILEDEPVATRLRLAGAERAARFTWQKTAALTRSVYEAVLANQHDEGEL